jgi:hypothetical protein
VYRLPFLPFIRRRGYAPVGHLGVEPSDTALSEQPRRPAGSWPSRRTAVPARSGHPPSRFRGGARNPGGFVLHECAGRDSNSHDRSHTGLGRCVAAITPPAQRVTDRIRTGPPTSARSSANRSHHGHMEPFPGADPGSAFLPRTRAHWRERRGAFSRCRAGRSSLTRGRRTPVQKALCAWRDLNPHPPSAGPGPQPGVYTVSPQAPGAGTRSRTVPCAVRRRSRTMHTGGAAPQGFEPRPPGPGPGVLPLDERASSTGRGTRTLKRPGLS